MTAGDLRERIAFDMRLAADDGYGNKKGGWVEQFVVSARRRPLLGGETVMQGRLESRQPYVLTVRSSTMTREITAAWRARDTRSDATYNIRSIVNTDEKNAYLDILVDQGGAVG